MNYGSSLIRKNLMYYGNFNMTSLVMSVGTLCSCCFTYTSRHKGELQWYNYNYRAGIIRTVFHLKRMGANCCCHLVALVVNTQNTSMT